MKAALSSSSFGTNSQPETPREVVEGPPPIEATRYDKATKERIRGPGSAGYAGRRNILIDQWIARCAAQGYRVDIRRSNSDERTQLREHHRAVKATG